MRSNKAKPRRCTMTKTTAAMRGHRQPEKHRSRHVGVRLQLHQQDEAESRVGELGDKFERHVDDRAGGRQRRRHPGQAQRPGAENVAADLR